MRIRTFFLLVCLLAAIVCPAQEIYPVPQEIVRHEGEVTLPLSFQLIGETNANPHAVRKLKEIWKGREEGKEKMLVIIGERGDKAVRKYNRMIPQRTEGFYLSVNRDRIILAGNDERGTFYAARTLEQLVQDGILPMVDIKDYPAIRFRGVVEGFYGTPWSHEARLKQLKFYGENKLNTYIYGPKDDPYHSSPHWRKPYPEKEAKQISELVKVAADHEVDFVWAIHPGQDIKWTTEDRDSLLAKFEEMYRLGVRSFAVFFDDIAGEGTNPVRQAELLNVIDNQFIRTKKDVTPLIMCPTEYNKSWSNPKGGYLTTLGTQLNPSVQIMWTGDRVISDITAEGLQWINALIRRPAYIWWNFPVSDYVRDHLLMGPVYGNDTHISRQMSGFVSNPMEHAEASKIAVFCVADYAWNPEKYDSETSWRAAIRRILPGDAEALEVFATHNSDLGPNGHGYRRDESVKMQPVVSRFLESYRNGQYVTGDYELLLDEFNKIAESADILLINRENADLIREMEPWLYQFGILGEYGREALALVKAVEKGDSLLVLRKYKHLKALQQRRYDVDQRYNQNPYQPGVKTGSKIMQPLADELFVLATRKFNRQTGGALKTDIFTSPHHSYSTVPQLAALPVRVKATQVIVSPVLEVVKWDDGQYLGVKLDQDYVLGHLDADLGIKEAGEWLRLEISADGVQWQEVAMTAEQNRLKADFNRSPARYIRLVNVSGQKQQSYLRRFIVTIKK